VSSNERRENPLSVNTIREPLIDVARDPRQRRTEVISGWWFLALLLIPIMLCRSYKIQLGYGIILGINSLL